MADEIPRTPDGVATPDFAGASQRVADAAESVFVRNDWRAALAEQAVEAINDVLASGGDLRWGPDVYAAFGKAADVLDRARDKVHQYLGEQAYAVGRSVGLPDLTANLVARVVVSMAGLPWEMQMQAGAIAIRTTGLCLQASLVAGEKPHATQPGLAQRLQHEWSRLAVAPEPPRPPAFNASPGIGVFNPVGPGTPPNNDESGLRPPDDALARATLMEVICQLELDPAEGARHFKGLIPEIQTMTWQVLHETRPELVEVLLQANLGLGPGVET